ncbi:MAG: OmpA family protein [Nitrospinota bacterium]
MKDKTARWNGFHIILVLSCLTFFSFNAYGAEPPLKDTKLEAGLRLGVKFEFNSTNLTRKSLEYLDKLAKQLKSTQWANEQFIIEGHTDTVGKKQVNMKFSRKRAAAVKSYLVEKHKIDPDRISTVGFGESMPLDKSKSVKANVINRRVIMRHVNGRANGTLNGLENKNYIVVAVLLAISGLLGVSFSRFLFNKV